jgi:hypothetical protein
MSINVRYHGPYNEIHDEDPDTYEDDLFEIHEKAIQVAIKERPIVPWLAEDKSVMWESVGGTSRLIHRTDD